MEMAATANPDRIGQRRSREKVLSAMPPGIALKTPSTLKCKADFPNPFRKR